MMDILNTISTRNMRAVIPHGYPVLCNCTRTGEESIQQRKHILQGIVLVDTRQQLLKELYVLGAPLKIAGRAL